MTTLGNDLGELAWREVPISTATAIDSVLVTLVSFNAEKIPQILGTGFIISGNDTSAIAITAAHNFEFHRDLQNPNKLAAPSALAEFLPLKQVSVDSEVIRAVHQNGLSLDFCEIGGAYWDNQSDVALFHLRPQQHDDLRFKYEIKLSPVSPSVGDTVCALGYSDLKEFVVAPGTAIIRRKLRMRLGRVLSVHPEGNRFCKSPCVITSIPVFSGMSGGPVGVYSGMDGGINAFGFISYDPEPSPLLDPQHDIIKDDETIAGSSLVPLIPANMVSDEGTSRVFDLLMRDIRSGISSQFQPIIDFKQIDE